MSPPHVSESPVPSALSPGLDELNVAGDKEFVEHHFAPDADIPSLAAIKKQIPAHCFRPSLSVSLYYVARDIFFLALLYGGAWATYGTPIHAPYLPVFWFFTGFFMWAVFVLGHDCGHGSFSKNKTVNSFLGHILHSAILVPFHSWRISHRKHHKNTGNFEEDEIFYPMPESEYAGVTAIARFVYSNTFFLASLGYPIYLWKGYGNRSQNGSHMTPNSDLFTEAERGQVLLSVGCYAAMFAFLATLAAVYGVAPVVTYYFIPYAVYSFFLLVVTFLHHTEPGAMWYSSRAWNYVKGNLQSVDRVYFFLEHFHHDIGTHVVHHLFPAIPHYHLREANAAVKPFLGKLHKVETANPVAQLPVSVRTWAKHHVMPDKTDIFAIPSTS